MSETEAGLHQLEPMVHVSKEPIKIFPTYPLLLSWTSLSKLRLRHWPAAPFRKFNVKHEFCPEYIDVRQFARDIINPSWQPTIRVSTSSARDPSGGAMPLQTEEAVFGSWPKRLPIEVPKQTIGTPATVRSTPCWSANQGDQPSFR